MHPFPFPLRATTRRRDDPRIAGICIIGFLLLEIVSQLALALMPAMSNTAAIALRIPLRSLPFAASIALAFILPGDPDNRARFHPAFLSAICVLAIVALGLVHPQSNTLRARLATVAMYAAILAPLFWVGRLRVDAKLLRAIIVTMWVFSSLSAAVGALQTLRPDWQWLQPNLSAIVQNHDDAGEMLKIALASGDSVFRPMGLSDQPGAAATAGLMTIVLGAALLARSRSATLWSIVIASMGVGLFCILLSQLRSVLVMTGVCVISFLFVMTRAGQWRTVSKVAGAIAIAGLLGAISAVVVGGASVTDRIASLVRDDPREIYYENRGHFLEHTFIDVLPNAPLGAGLGRWGMINFYFGAPDDANSPPLYSEIMWTSWAYDGGFPLILAYTLAIAVAIWQSWKFATRVDDPQNRELQLWAAVIFAFDIGCLAVTFNYPLFMGQTGLEFWLLNAALFAAFQSRRSKITA